jgi:ribosomal protein S18 acetylase RimI-like enzyme
MSDVDCDATGNSGESMPISVGAAGLGQMTVGHATSVDELTACFPVIAHLRPKLASPSEWCDRAAGMYVAGYRVLVWRIADEVRAVAGYRITENLIHGRFLYVDDLVVCPEHRGQKLGSRLLTELSEIGRQALCTRLVLDTAATNLAAQRFYHREGLLPAIVGFVKAL